MPENDSREPKRVSLSGHASLGPITTSGTLTVIPAARIEVEPSEILKYLRLKNGDIEVPNRVFVVQDGQRYEITMDSLPDEEGRRTLMTEEHYRLLFEELGIETDERMGYVLRLDGRSMGLYFNGPREGIGLHFVAYMKYAHHYPAELWERIDLDLVPDLPDKDRPPLRFPTRPWPGLERRAFEKILASPDYPLGRRRTVSQS